MEIKVTLTVIEDSDVLVFYLDEEKPNEYVVNLNNANNQQDIKRVFVKLLEMLFDNDIKLQLEIAEGYSKGLYKEVCTEYINELQKELLDTKENLINQLK